MKSVRGGCQCETATVLAMDLDGTLLDSTHRLSNRTGCTLQRVADRGFRVVVATARPPRDTIDLVGMLDPVPLLICNNGAFWADPSNGLDHRLSRIDQHEVAGIAEQIRVMLPQARFGVEAYPHLVLEQGFTLAPQFHGATCYVDNLAKYAIRADPDDCPTQKLLVQNTGKSSEYIASVTATVGERYAVTRSCEEFCEVLAQGTSKARALVQVANWLGVAATDVIAFGDMTNDIAMLQWAGCSVAVENAEESVRDVAVHVTESNDANGVAAYVDRLLETREGVRS